MECTKEFLNVSQVMINSLKEGINLDRYYLFKPNEAKHLLRILDLFCDKRTHYIDVSFWNDKNKDQTIAIKIIKKPFGYDIPLIKYLDFEVDVFLNNIKITKTPKGLRELVRINFI